jgi:tetratricopeptide (TPR) repeat protein
VNVITLVAWGGVGKSCLVNRWLREMAKKNYEGAERVFGWSFYRQGSDGGAVSGDLFVSSALRWFGDTDPVDGGPWDRGVRLAKVVRARRTLLLLDGLELLQHPPGPQEGRLKDQSLLALVRDLAAYNPGLVVITTRFPVTDLIDFQDGAAAQHELAQLSASAGAEILRTSEILGTQAELQEASDEFGGHALALTLLASFLRDVCGGDVNRRSEIRSLQDDVRYGGHARRVMASYEDWFGEGPELCVLRVVGLFDKPADSGSVSALRKTAVIPGLTDALHSLDETRWQQVLAGLRRSRLLSPGDSPATNSLEAHPLVREYFRKRLIELWPQSWREGNDFIFRHLISCADETPTSLEALTPLYAAVAHGCRAGRHQLALDEVYWKRILRGEEQFSWLKLGALGSDLEALSNFFTKPWDALAPGLKEKDEGFVLGQAGMLLGKQGRLEDAIRVMEVGLQRDIRCGRLSNASVTAGNVSNTFLLRGKLAMAIKFGSESAMLADRSGDPEEMRISRTVWANALHHAGLFEKAEQLFREAESMTATSAGIPMLTGPESFEYCHLLLSLGKYAEARTRAQAILQLAARFKQPQIALRVGLILALALMLEADSGHRVDLSPAEPHLNGEIANLRSRRELDVLPLALILRAMYGRLTQDMEGACRDLDDAMNIATHSGMELYEMDCRLEYASLYLVQGEREKARESITIAAEMIRRNGYHRRDTDVRKTIMLLQ